MRNAGRVEEKLYILAAIIAAILSFGSAAQAGMSASTTSINFGSQAVGTISSSQSVAITNVSKNRTSILSVSISDPHFVVATSSLPATVLRGGSLTLLVTFAPTIAQAYSGSLTIVTNNGGTVTIGLVGSGRAPITLPISSSPTTNSINASPASLSFSTQVGGNTSAQSVTINDTTLSPLPFTVSADQPWITLGANSGTTQSTGTSLQIGINSSGMAAGSYSGNVILTATGVSNSPFSVPATLTVTPPPAVPPSITSQPASLKINAGQTATFNVGVTGTSPMSYQWIKNGGAISGATSASYTTPAETTADNNAQFSVSVSNSAGLVTSGAAVLTVTNPVVAPTITTQPASTNVVAGNAATFSVGATGTSPMSYQWSKNGAAISGATSSSYTTPAETTADNNAQFTVGVSNSAGAVTSSAAVLTVTNPIVAPSISTQPSSTSVIAGNTATFTVAVTGTSPLTYQWSKNGAAIGGATTSSYTTPAETTADNNAQFTVSVSNSAGTATSNAAILTVSASTLLLNASSSSLTFGSVNVSSNSSQNVTLTNAGNSNVTISNVTVNGAGFNASGVSTGLILSPGQNATLTATFAPASAGSVTGSVAVASNASNSPDSISLSGTGVAVVNHSVALSWTASTSSVMGYNTYSSTTSGGPYAKLTSNPAATTAYTDSTVQSGLTYYYVVTSVNSSNVESPYSSEVSAVIP